MDAFLRRLFSFQLLCVWWVATCVVVSASTGSSPTNTIIPVAFGFNGLEIYRFNNSNTEGLRHADLNQDGFNDLILINNSEAKINILLNRGTNSAPASTNMARPASARNVNWLGSDKRFEEQSISTEKRVATMALGDLNSDGFPDLAYYGEPKELVVRYRKGEKWGETKKFPIQDGALTDGVMAIGDINDDGRADLVMLGESHFYILRQDQNGVLEEPLKEPFTGAVKYLDLSDLDGNRLMDVLLFDPLSDNPLRVRFQRKGGKLSQECFFEMAKLRSLIQGNVDGAAGDELISVTQNSGRLQVQKVVQGEGEVCADDLRIGQVHYFALKKLRKNPRRGYAVADLNNDQAADLIVSEPDNNQLLVYWQRSGEGFGEAEVYPTLFGVTDIQVSHWTNSLTLNVFVLSAGEQSIGISAVSPEGKIEFPQPLQVNGKPLSIRVGSLKEKSDPVMALALDRDGKKILQVRNAKGVLWENPMENLRANPTGIEMADANQDGRTDLLVLLPAEKWRIFLQNRKGEFDSIEVPIPGGNPEDPSLVPAHFDTTEKKPVEFLVPIKNFARSLALTNEISSGNATNSYFRILEQLNADKPSSQVVSAATGVWDNEPMVLLWDSASKALLWYNKVNSRTWKLVKTLPLSGEYNRIQITEMNGDKHPDILLTGRDQFCTIQMNTPRWELKELATYETTVEKGKLGIAAVGDFNTDGTRDLAITENQENSIDLCEYSADGIQSKTVFKVFETKSFRGSGGGDVFEPREILAADLTGDNKDDIAILVHERVILYPQE